MSLELLRDAQGELFAARTFYAANGNEEAVADLNAILDRISVAMIDAEPERASKTNRLIETLEAIRRSGSIQTIHDAVDEVANEFGFAIDGAQEVTNV